MSRVRSRFSDRGGRLRLSVVAFWAGLVVLGVVGSSIPSTAATTSFSLGHLLLGGPTGPEDYVFKTGDVVFPDGGADTGSYYKAVVSDAAGTVRNPAFPCTSAAAFASTNNAYTVQASDPPSTSTAWTFTLRQWNNATCTGNPTKTASKKFFVAKPTVYADSALTTPKSTFGTSGTAYLTVAGLKPGNDWTTTWIGPSGTTACANTGGGDRPDVPSTGVLAGAGGYLQYRPNTTAVGAAWNRESNYETRPCPSFSSANQGAWKLRLGLDGKDFVVLSAFTVDVTPNPVVTLIDKPPALTNRTTASFSFSSNKASISYECKLDGGGFTGCTSPRLYTGLDDGDHTFSVRATSLGNLGLTTEYTWTVDTVAPATSITSTPPATSNSASANFTFASSEVGSTFSCGLDAGGFTPCASPKSYAGLGDGTHTFRVQAIDAAGNVDTSPASYSWQIAGVGPATTDTTPPGNVKRLKRTVAYRVLKLAWTRPSDSDFDHVKVFVSTNAKSPPRTLVYRGKGRAYTNKRFKNGLYYRYAVVSYDHIGNASRGAAAVVPPSILLRSPRNGAVVKSPPRLLWAPVPKATFYNVQLYSSSAKMLSAWPGKARLTLSRRWTYNGRRFQLKKGLYRWFVWPGFGPRASGRYGQLLGQATFRVR